MTKLVIIFGICYAFVGLLVAIRLLVSMLKDDWHGTNPKDRVGLVLWCGFMGMIWLPTAAFIWFLFGWRGLFEWRN